MKKINFVLLFLLLLASVENTRANDMISESNENFKNSWLYNFNPELINKIEIKNNKNINFVYNNKKQNIDDFTIKCNNIDLKQKNKENLIEQLPNGCNISLVDEVKVEDKHILIIYLCNNKGCEKLDKPYLCIEDNEEDCGF